MLASISQRVTFGCQTHTKPYNKNSFIANTEKSLNLIVLLRKIIIILMNYKYISSKISSYLCFSVRYVVLV